MLVSYADRFSRRFTHPHEVHTVPNVTGFEKRGKGEPDVERRRHQGEATESEEGDAIPDLLLKHPDATLATYV